ncbi:MAG: hypothetical protein ACQEVA_13645 [Myxococcota bacterium]
MTQEDNPFDELGIEPTASPERITAVLRERAQRASPAERERIKTLWRKLTINADERVRLALRAHPGDEDVGSRSTGELADLVPPRLGRLEPPVINATIEDVLLDDADEDDPPDECGPPAAFDRMSKLGD